MAIKRGDTSGALGALLEGDALRASFRRRRDENDYSKIPFDQEDKFSQQEWTIHKRTQSHLWMKKQKSPEALLEDRFGVCCIEWAIGLATGPRIIFVIIDMLIFAMMRSLKIRSKF
ncbi:MAG: hypothetical protein WDN50_03505 [Bradyrhizobium sp.]